MKKKLLAVFLLICLLAGLIPTGLTALAASKTVYVTSNTLPVYKTYSTSSKVLGTMSYGESMTLLATNSSWAQVKNSSGQTGYCKVSGISSSNPNKYNEKIYINASKVKVYKKPTTSASVMMTLSKNSSYTSVAVTPDKEWMRLKNGKSYGYVQTKYISTTMVDDNPSIPGGTTVYISANTLSAYKKASTSSKVLGVMSYGESMTLLALSGDWAQIRNSADAVGYCKLSGISTANPNNLELTVYVRQNGVKVYKKPLTSAATLTTAKLGDSFTAVGITADSEWARVKSGKNYGYIRTKDLAVSEPDDPQEPEEPLGSTVYVVSSALPVYASASSSSRLLGTMYLGESMTLLTLPGDGWAQVRNASGATGFCRIDGLSNENPNKLDRTVYITEDGARLFDKPTTASTVLGTLKQNAKYTAVAVSDDGQWVRLKNGSHYGYIQMEYLSDEPVDPGDPIVIPKGTVYISANTLVAYQSPSTSSKSLGTMSYGESMKLLDVDDGWARIQNSSGAIGYCKYGGLSTVNPNSLNMTMYAQANGVKLYAKPLTSAKVSRTVNLNASLTVVAITEDDVWARVSLGSGAYAYVQTSSIADSRHDGDDGDITDISPKTVYIAATTLAVYASTSSSSTSLGTMSFGESLICNGTNSSWARVINSSGAVGYCRRSDLTDTNPNSYNVTLYAQSNGVKIYKKASTSSTVLSTVNLNAKLTGVAINSDKSWIRLKNGSEYGYVQASNVDTNQGGSSNPTVDKVIALAKAQSGKPYVYGTSGPSSFDCSGLTYYVFRNAAGITLKRTSQSQGYDSSYAQISSASNLRVGDLVFFNTNTSDNDLCDHVGIYLGSGNFIHASSAGGKVITSSLTSGYYNRTFSWGRRVL